MLMFIVPVFVKVFDDLGGELPKPTQIMISLSNALRGYWFVIFPRDRRSRSAGFRR